MAWTLVQKSSVPGTNSSGASAQPSLGAASAAGSLLVAVVGDTDEAAAVSTASGWQRGVHATQAFAGSADIWFYPDNPGGITSLTFTDGGANLADSWMAEFTTAGVAGAMLEAAGTGTATGTTCPVTADEASTAGDLAICMFGQSAGGGTWTAPSGWSLLGSDAGSAYGNAWSGYLLSAPAGTELVTGAYSLSGQWAGAVALFSASPPAGASGSFMSFFA
jgi:hypothetical protein